MVDAGPLYAYVDADDQHHEACADLLETYPGPPTVSTLVITEVVYLLGSRLSTQAELRFLADLASEAFDIETVHPTDWLRIADLVNQCRIEGEGKSSGTEFGARGSSCSFRTGRLCSFTRV
ncbi:PIN domain-containing protein [Frankia sp. Hr75.2]|nr:PIN domain-containing protein [Frankia sp. Hr75.2]